MVGLHHAGPEPLPDHGAHHGADLQLVDDLHALGIPDKHAEAITSRPLALHGIARQTRHANQTTVEITSTHSKAPVIAGGADEGERLFQAHQDDCGAVDSSRTLALILSAAFRYSSTEG